ncbi:hypothetical protein [Defluviimonas salinarum]|uniref:Uncharacterized protein n=1 Tax=Defluviimonas salinarum TaxID=2992147 RepID=A0ABT3JAS7_9RHOB|nr:hypothetical protein [Defluviimonas salinarum]MCW3784805.1 hypothetical protein [Defluviimonas salinarum]
MLMGDSSASNDGCGGWIWTLFSALSLEFCLLSESRTGIEALYRKPNASKPSPGHGHVANISPEGVPSEVGLTPLEQVLDIHSIGEGNDAGFALDGVAIPGRDARLTSPETFLQARDAARRPRRKVS